MSKELKPCPFCGGRAEIRTVGELAYIECSICHCQTEGVYYKQKEEATRAWNRRPSHWHTGTPTKQGWYLLKVMHEDGIVYYTNLLENNTDLQWHYAMYGKIIAYKEIKP